MNYEGMTRAELLRKIKRLQLDRDKLLSVLQVFASEESWFQSWDSIVPVPAWNGRGDPRKLASSAIREVQESE